MNFSLDHDVPDDVVVALEALGHGVTRSRVLERAALVRLLDGAGDKGIQENINFA